MKPGFRLMKRRLRPIHLLYALYTLLILLTLLIRSILNWFQWKSSITNINLQHLKIFFG